MTCQNQSKVFMVFWLVGLKKLYKKLKYNEPRKFKKKAIENQFLATDVFPNPGEPHMDTIRVDSENKWPMISSHSFWRPVK